MDRETHAKAASLIGFLATMTEREDHRDLMAQSAGHHAHEAQRCWNCGGEGTYEASPGAWISCSTCGRRGWLPAAPLVRTETEECRGRSSVGWWRWRYG